MHIDHYLGLLAKKCGIEYEATMELKVRLLKAMDILAQDFDYFTQDGTLQQKNIETARALLEQRYDAEFINIVHHVPVLRQNHNNNVVVALPKTVKKIKWNFYEDEDPKKYYKGEASVNDNNSSTAERSLNEQKRYYCGEVPVEELGVYTAKEEDELTERMIDGVLYKKYNFRFPFEVKFGYHQVEFEYETADGQKRRCKTHLISAPEKCYDPLGIDEGKKTWGVPVQLYEQVSENNLGIGNFSDLAQLGHILGRNGAGIMGVNPLHGGRDDQPENASPYGPDSRMFFNYIYLDVTAVEEFKADKSIQDYYNSPEFQAKLKRNRRRIYVDYTVTQELVDDILQRCFEKFDQDHTTEDHNRFEVFCDEYDGVLDMFATFRAINKYFSKMDPQPLDWRDWPESFKSPDSPAVQAFKKMHAKEIEFFKYTQWLCEKQLANVQENCINSGMKIGLYMDMAVGASRKGFEAWYYPEFYLKGTAGAKVDDLSINGQQWGLLAFNPEKLQADGYRLYRRILDANMRYAGCLRIDHVLQLNRLCIFPEGSEKGDYVYYNTEELLSLVALESHRHKTMIIGEDLGVTQQKFRDLMESYGIMQYKVLPFEHTEDVWHSARRPEDYIPCSVCAPSTHDTPTLINQWNTQHILQQKSLGILNDTQCEELLKYYRNHRQALDYALDERQCYAEVGGVKSPNPAKDFTMPPEKHIPAVTTYLASSRSAIMMMPFSDIFGVNEMGNIPGTTEMAWSLKEPLLEIAGDKAYPNWRKKSHFPIEHIEQVDNFKTVVSILNKYRPDGNDGRGRYYQFERPGLNMSSLVDFEKAKRLYNILRYKEDYQKDQMREHRYGDAAVRRFDNRRVTTQKRFNKMQAAWLKHKKDLGL